MIEDKIYIYPIYITVDPNEEYPYFVEIPDVDGFTQGKDLAEAITMARDYIGFAVIDKLQHGEPLPLPDKIEYVQHENQIKTLVDINFKKYKSQHDNKVVKKTLTIPNYLNELGNERGINFSLTLTEALKEKLGV
jgi:predicted RNase H-like HicB family nuclease